MAAVLFMSWRRPSSEQQKFFISASGDFNYDSRFLGLSSPSSSTSTNPLSPLARTGFSVNHSRTLIGSGGAATFRSARSAILSWRHVSIPWAFVNPETRIQKGTRFCICAKVVLPWVILPLEIIAVEDTEDHREASGPSNRRSSGAGAGAGAGDGLKGSLAFSSGTLGGHLLAGEERFAVEWDEYDNVWYEIFSFSKPAHPLAAIGYPFVRFVQKSFARQSTQALLEHVNSHQNAS